MAEKKNILLVDDDSIAHFLIERVVNSTGLARNIYKALNGKEALNMISGTVPDVILLDLNMPIMNGFEFIKAFRNLQLSGKENILIIIISSSDNETDIERAKEMGIKYYLTKPITSEIIRSILQKEFA